MFVILLILFSMVSAEILVTLDRTQPSLVEQHSDSNGKKTLTTTTMERMEVVARDNKW